MDCTVRLMKRNRNALGISGMLMVRYWYGPMIWTITVLSLGFLWSKVVENNADTVWGKVCTQWSQPNLFCLCIYEKLRATSLWLEEGGKDMRNDGEKCAQSTWGSDWSGCRGVSALPVPNWTFVLGKTIPANPPRDRTSDQGRN